VDGVAYHLHRPTAHSCLLRGHGILVRHHPVFVVVIVGDVCRGKGSFPGCHYLIEDLSSSVPIYGILHIINGFYQVVLILWQRRDVI
jgi:hypothetical protein